MDPTHFIAHHSIPKSAAKSQAQDFYDTHSFEGFHRLKRAVTQLAMRLRGPHRSQAKTQAFAVSHPAE